MRKIRTLTGAGLVVRLNDQGGLVVEGLKSIHPDGANELRRFIKENKPEIVEELRALAEQAKSPGVEHAEIIDPDSAKEQKAIENANICPEKPAIPDVAAKELIDLDRRGFIKLDLSGPAPAFTLADEYGPGDRQFIQGLIDEAETEPGTLPHVAAIPFTDRFCNPPGYLCKYFVPKQAPGADQDAGLCEHSAIPETPAIVTFTKNGKEKRRKAEDPERLNWIPNLTACPGRELIQTREARP
jgi:hypothetical protein